jgi:hypothetical protein
MAFRMGNIIYYCNTRCQSVNLFFEREKFNYIISFGKILLHQGVSALYRFSRKEKVIP